MIEKIPKPSGRRKILDLLRKHPEGLTAAKIRQLILADYAISEPHLATEIQRLAKEKKIKNNGRCRCTLCALQSSVYKIDEANVKGELNA